MASQWTRRDLLRAGGVVGALGIAGCVGTGDGDRWAVDEPIPVASARQYNSPGCSCCERYATYLGDALEGDLAESVPDDVDAVKREHGIPEDLRSCHTVVLDEYAVEGHVPADAVATLLEDRPAIDGIALPGMPAGSPGMPGTPEDPLVVRAVGGDRTGTEYATF